MYPPNCPRLPTVVVSPAAPTCLAPRRWPSWVDSNATRQAWGEASSSWRAASVAGQLVAGHLNVPDAVRGAGERLLLQTVW